MKQLIAEFMMGCSKPEDLKIYNLPEVAFTGRSNVGKSSLLNSIVLQKNLARISSTPGKTQQINLYKIENKWIFADLPGFGYASVSKVEREKWKKLNLDYLKQRIPLKLVCMLVDSRNEPMESDLGLIQYLEEIGRKYIIILTKKDKISTKVLEGRIKQYEFLLQYCNNNIEILPYSSRTNEGRESLTAIIKRVAVI